MILFEHQKSLKYFKIERNLIVQQNKFFFDAKNGFKRKLLIRKNKNRQTESLIN